MSSERIVPGRKGYEKNPAGIQKPFYKADEPLLVMDMLQDITHHDYVEGACRTRVIYIGSNELNPVTSRDG